MIAPDASQLIKISYTNGWITRCFGADLYSVLGFEEFWLKITQLLL